MNATTTHRSYVTASAIVFALVALFQVWRAATGLPVQIGGFAVPVAASWVVAVFTGALSVWGWRSR